MKEASEIIDLITAHFIDDEKIQAVFLFGSVVDDCFSKESDVDIAIDLGCVMGVDVKLDFIESISSLTGREIDLIDLHTQEGLLHYKIMTKGLQVKCLPELYLYHEKKALYFHADFLPQLNQLSEARIRRSLDGS